MKMLLSKEDLEAVRQLRDLNILDEVKGHLLDQRKGIILISCADGDQFNDIFSQKVKLQEGHCEYPRVHTFCWNGGALRLAPNSPVNKPGRSTCRDLLDEIKDARMMKAIDTIALYIHAPCGKARAYNLSFINEINLLMSAKTNIKKENPNIHVACFGHIDYGDKKRTYFISRENWFRERQNISGSI